VTALAVTVGSSDVAGILGLSPWSGPWDAWARLTGLVPRYSDEDTKPQARGRMFEPAILARYALEERVAVVPGPPIGQPPIVGPEPWMHARPDAWAGQPSTPPDRVVEAKTARRLDPAEWGPPGTDEVPPWYAVQCVWQLAVVRLDRCDLAAYSPMDDEWRVYRLRRAPAVERAVVGRVRAWVERHVVKGHPPDLDGSAACRRMLERRWRAATGRDHVATAEDVAEVERAIRLRADRDAIDAELDLAVARLQARMGEADALVVGGQRVATWRGRQGARRIDTERLRRERPDVAEQYTTVGEPGRTWRWT
jgi:putative phage-type endonuclease